VTVLAGTGIDVAVSILLVLLIAFFLQQRLVALFIIYTAIAVYILCSVAQPI